MSDVHDTLQKLRSGDPHTRFDALTEISQAAIPAVTFKVDALRIAMDDKHGYNRLQAIRALRPFWPAGEVVRVFAAKLSDESFIAEAVVAFLGEIADEEALKMLRSTFGNPSRAALRVPIILHLNKAPQRFLFEFVLAFDTLHHKDERIRAATVTLLGAQRNATMRKLFKAALRDPDARVRANAVEALSGILDGVELARIVAPYAVADPNNRVRANSLIVLIRAGIQKAKEFLIQMAGHRDARWRASAAWAMRQVPHCPSFAPWVRQLASDPDEQVVAQAEQTLPQYA